MEIVIRIMTITYRVLFILYNDVYDDTAAILPHIVTCIYVMYVYCSLYRSSLQHIISIRNLEDLTTTPLLLVVYPPRKMIK